MITFVTFYGGWIGWKRCLAIFSSFFPRRSAEVMLVGGAAQPLFYINTSFLHNWVPSLVSAHTEIHQDLFSSDIIFSQASNFHLYCNVTPVPGAANAFSSHKLWSTAMHNEYELYMTP